MTEHENTNWRGLASMPTKPSASRLRQFYDKAADDEGFIRAAAIDGNSPPSMTDYVRGEDGAPMDEECWREVSYYAGEARGKWGKNRRKYNDFINRGADNFLIELFSDCGSATRMASVLGVFVTAEMVHARLGELMPDWKALRREMLIDQAHSTLIYAMDADMMQMKYRLAAAKIVFDNQAKLDAKAMELDNRHKLKAAAERLSDEHESDHESNGREMRLSSTTTDTEG